MLPRNWGVGFCKDPDGPRKTAMPVLEIFRTGSSAGSVRRRNDSKRQSNSPTAHHTPFYRLRPGDWVTVDPEDRSWSAVVVHPAASAPHHLAFLQRVMLEVFSAQATEPDDDAAQAISDGATGAYEGADVVWIGRGADDDE